MEPGASYGRISDNDGAGVGVGVADQHRRNHKRAEADGITIKYELTDDDRSAYKEDVIRDDYQRLLGLIRGDLIKYVLVKHCDRLHRQPAEAEAFLQLARKHGVIVVTASGMRYLLNTADGRRAFREAATGAAFESEHRGERTSEFAERRALEGEYHGGSRRPFGWGVPTGVVRRVRDKKTGENKDVEILDMTKHNPVEAAEIRRWADELLAKTTAGEVLRSVTVPTVTGGPWRRHVMRQILTSPRVSGHSIHQGKIVKRDAWDPIISEDTRQALILLFADPSRRKSSGNTPKWLGSLIYLCGLCESNPTVTDRSTYIMKVSGKVRGEPGYRCELRMHCLRPAESLDQYVEDAVIVRLARDDVSDLLPGRTNVDVVALRNQIAVLRQRKVQAALMFATDGDAEALAAVKADLDEQIIRLQAEVSAADTTSPIAEFEGVNTIAEAAEIWDSYSLGRRREILRTIATVVVLPPPRGPRPPGTSPLAVDESSVRIHWTPFVDSLASNGKLDLS